MEERVHVGQPVELFGRRLVTATAHRDVKAQRHARQQQEQANDVVNGIEVLQAKAKP